MSTVNIDGYEVNTEFSPIVNQLFDYAVWQRLSRIRVDWGWSFKVHRGQWDNQCFFHIQVRKRPDGIVPQLRYMRPPKINASIVQGYRHQFAGLIDTDNPEFPLISSARLQHSAALTQYLAACSWFLRQIGAFL